jgi:hypothetical protein
MNGNRQHRAGLLLADGEHAVADMLPANVHHVAAPQMSAFGTKRTTSMLPLGETLGPFGWFDFMSKKKKGGWHPRTARSVKGRVKNDLSPA